ncbi:MAG: hypothetical protein UR99_C0023G0001, partial [Candidatus Moranbacteria bacterium GW2011_GWD2_36_12]
MRTLKMVAMAMMLVVLVARFATADIILDNRNDITNNQRTTVNTNVANTATGGEAEATGGNVDFKNSYVSPIQPYNPNAPAPIQTGAALTIGEWGLFLPMFFEAVTMEQATSLSDAYTGFFVSNRIGDEAIMNKNLKPSASIEIAKYWGKMGNDQYVASFPIFGKKGDQLEGLLGLATRRAMELGANKIGIMIRVIKEINTKGLSVGVGAGAGLYVPCNGGVGTGVNFGAYISNTKTEDMYELNVICLIGNAYEPPVITKKSPPPAPPVAEKKPEPAPKPVVCSQSKMEMFLKRIHELTFSKEAGNKGIEFCEPFCYNNYIKRAERGHLRFEMYICTKDVKYLYGAIEDFEIAERNKIYGYDLHKHSDVEDIIIGVE